jgi:NAD/NADP transhydrogenase alpha subunit
VVVQAGAGVNASVPDANFSAVGASIVNDAAAAYASDIILEGASTHRRGNCAD